MLIEYLVYTRCSINNDGGGFSLINMDIIICFFQYVSLGLCTSNDAQDLPRTCTNITHN